MSTTKPVSSQISDGIVIPAEFVTWPLYLQVSRLRNSKAGGWNSATHWSTRGMAHLLDHTSTVALWTENSLQAKALPAPRKKGFKIRERSEAKHRGEGVPKNENALNWDLAQRLASYCTGCAGEIVASYEVPLAATSAGQLKVDSMVFHRGGRIEIIELKRRRAKDTPLMALVELICYALQTKRCWERLAPEIRHDAGVEVGRLRQIHLVIAAPEYWSCCNPKAGELTSDQEAGLAKIIALVAKKSGLEMNLTLADYDDTALDQPFVPRKQPPSWSVLTKRLPKPA